MEHVNIIERVKKVIEEQMGVDASDVKFNDSLVDDLGADSLDLLELVMAVEEEFDIEIADEEAERVKTVAEVIGTVFLKKTGLPFDPQAIQLGPKDAAFPHDLIENPPPPATALVEAMSKHRADAQECPKDDSWNCKYCSDAKTCTLHSGGHPTEAAKKVQREPEPETVKLRLTVDVEYKLNGERVKDADFHLHELVQTAVNRGLFTGDSPMEVESHSYNVERLQ